VSLFRKHLLFNERKFKPNSRRKDNWLINDVTMNKAAIGLKENVQNRPDMACPKNA
jgi:hypothetical protein